jgi:hypothetical protein
MSNTSKPKREKRASTPKKAKSATPIDVCAPSQPSDAAVSPEVQHQEFALLQEQLNDALKTGGMRDYFLPPEQESATRAAISLPSDETTSEESVSPAAPVAVVTPAKTNMSEDPFAPYKASGRWVTLWLYAPGGLSAADWETKGGNLHYSSALKLHSVKVPWYMRWAAKPSLVKMIFHVGYDPYPDLNENLNAASRRKVSAICRGLVKRHLRSVVLFRAHTKGVKGRIRHWGESWPKCIKRLAVKHINRHTVSDWLREKIHRWEYRQSLGNRTLSPKASNWSWAEPLDV